jgi:hypothetical protein
MNKEQQELVDEAYKNFIYNPSYKAEGVADLMESQAGQLVKCPTQQEFIDKIKTDSKFSEKWGLKIEERELIQRERLQLLWKVCREENIPPDSKELEDFWLRYNEIMSKYNIPTRLITITYNDKTIENYE